MYELMQAAENTWYIQCPARMGIWRLNDTDVCLIDGGSDRDAAKKALKILTERHWRLRMVLNTHSHADHVGGNALLQERTGCSICAPDAECSFIRDPRLEPALLYGGRPCRELQDKFLMARPSVVQPLTPKNLPPGLEMLRLDGHALGMVGFRTADDVWFLGDCLTSTELLSKYPVPFLYDPGHYLESLERVAKLSGALFIPAHAGPVTDIRPLAELNRDHVLALLESLISLCAAGRAFEEILRILCEQGGIQLDFHQYVLVGSTIRSCLSWLHDQGRLNVDFQGGRLLWRASDPSA